MIFPLLNLLIAATPVRTHLYLLVLYFCPRLMDGRDDETREKGGKDAGRLPRCEQQIYVHLVGLYCRPRLDRGRPGHVLAP